MPSTPVSGRSRGRTGVRCLTRSCPLHWGHCDEETVITTSPRGSVTEPEPDRVRSPTLCSVHSATAWMTRRRYSIRNKGAPAIPVRPQHHHEAASVLEGPA